MGAQCDCRLPPNNVVWVICLRNYGLLCSHMRHIGFVLHSTPLVFGHLPALYTVLSSMKKFLLLSLF